MKKLDIIPYQQLLESAIIMERDGHGAKVLVLPDGNLVKIFRRKSWLSSAMFFPYARRFVNNTRMLSRLSIPTCKVLDICYCRGASRHLVTYRPLPGETLRGRLRVNPAECKTLLANLAAFVAQLHHNGVYFRSIHFGNIIVSPDRQSLGLIDVADMTIKRRPLSVAVRLRNFRHMLRYREDVEALHAFGWIDFVESYLEAAGLPPKKRFTLLSSLSKLSELSLPVAGGPLK